MSDEPMTDTVAAARRALALVDLTNLDDQCTSESIDTLCRRAAGPHGHTAAVCVWPRFVRQAKRSLTGTSVLVATVVNFPAGGTEVAATVTETTQALADGADEIDLVLPHHAFLAGDVASAEAMVSAVRASVVAPARLKVILETGGYPDQDAVRRATRLAIEQGADFVKTSTGKTSVSASPEAVRTMLAEIRDSGWPVGIKPSGGIRTLDDALAYLRLADEVMGDHWATPDTFRFGASGLLDALESAIEHDVSGGPDGADAAY
jgi:deoxyribose-phosphate aldolase